MTKSYYCGIISNKLLSINIKMIIIYCILIVLWIFYIYLYLLSVKINKLEEIIKKAFLKRTNTIPSVFELSKNHINKHEEIFKEIIRLKKIEFSLNSKAWVKMYEIINIEWLIHHEIDFIFKICNKHDKLLQDWKFLYIRDIIIKHSFDIWKYINIYKEIVLIFNKIIRYKNLTIIWFLLPIESIDEI